MREVSETPQRPTIGRKEPVRYSPEQIRMIHQQQRWQQPEESEEESEVEQ